MMMTNFSEAVVPVTSNGVAFSPSGNRCGMGLSIRYSDSLTLGEELVSDSGAMVDFRTLLIQNRSIDMNWDGGPSVDDKIRAKTGVGFFVHRRTRRKRDGYGREGNQVNVLVRIRLLFFFFYY